MTSGFVPESDLNGQAGIAAGSAEDDDPKPRGPKGGGGRPAAYKLASGLRVPGVTTILGKFKDPGPLMFWAWQQGVDGKDFRQVRDEAANAGTIAHDWIEDEIHGRPRRLFPDASDDVRERARMALLAFGDWREQVKLEVVETEVPLISEAYRFGGTLDAIAMVAGKLKLLDWKSSNAVYGEYIGQVAAYRQLLRERGTEVDGAQLLRFGKEHADFHAHSYPTSVLDLGWSYFSHVRELYDLGAQLKKVAA